jgi:ATP-dependent Clp protease ATP-binding subunit ClpC
MYERFTDRVRKALALANQEAERLNHEFVGSEHILLGLINEGCGLGALALQKFGVDVEKARFQYGKLVRPGLQILPVGERPLTPRVKKVTGMPSKNRGI